MDITTSDGVRRAIGHRRKILPAQCPLVQGFSGLQNAAICCLRMASWPPFLPLPAPLWPLLSSSPRDLVSLESLAQARCFRQFL